MIVFRYRREFSKGNNVVFRPVAEVFLHGKYGSWIKFNPYIDSGADVSLIPLSLGKLLGFSAGEEVIEQVGGIRGSVPVVYNKCPMRIGGVDVVARIGWALVEEVPPLLGRDGVFDRFQVTFKQSERKIIFEEA